MKIAIYSPYLDTAGGGEKYILTIAEILSKKEEVDILLDKHLAQIGMEHILNRIRLLHEIDLSKTNFKIAPFGEKGTHFERLIFLKQYNFLFYLTDGSIFFSSSKNSIIHFQVPLKNSYAKGILGRLKLLTWKKAIYNSKFTKSIINKSWPIKGEVIYPPVDIKKFFSDKKKKQVISVGRFKVEKKHSILIKTFKKLIDEGLSKDWSFHLAGGAQTGDKTYIDQLKRESENYKIFFHENVSFPKLVKLYGESSIYWHAMGFEETDPAKFEHFGITTVEAMASGCVPIVINLGGQPEIVAHNKEGFLWNDLAEFELYTLKVIKNNKLMKKLATNAIEKAKNFSKEKFIEKINQLIYET